MWISYRQHYHCHRISPSAETDPSQSKKERETGKISTVRCHKTWWEKQWCLVQERIKQCVKESLEVSNINDVRRQRGWKELKIPPKWIPDVRRVWGQTK